MVGLYDHQPLVRIFPRHCARGTRDWNTSPSSAQWGEDVTVGAKRNLTVWLASGEYCVNLLVSIAAASFRKIFSMQPFQIVFGATLATG